ncbi:MAG: S8 family serine peptidase, partial [Anaerolineaceae bacterium]|nr:S8 family serine peptidase [Anaerolineaceae bacterium]
MNKHTLRVFLPILLMVGLIFGLVQSTSAVSAASEQGLEKVETAVLDALSAKGSADYVVEMAEHADLSAAYEITDWDARGWFVYNTLRETAARTQAPVIAILEKSGAKYQSFFAGNEIAVTGSDMTVLSQIASLDAVSHIRYPRTASIEPIPVLTRNLFDFSIDALDWGLNDTKAPAFWSTFGVQGDGIVVANIDTGVQWNHPALDQAFKCGSNPSDPACWADPSSICGGSACDNNGHGTHTMGTMVGDDDPTLTYQVGMAPNAKWIACKGCETNSCSDTALNACADWILAPGGSPSNRPNIVNNSWGGGGGDTWYLTKVQSWRAAGIFPVFSSGNPGSTCGAIGSPSDYQESFATANHQSDRVINSSSGRGPSTYGHEPYTKPNISAPGTNICSAVPTNSWSCSYTGTSMAAPHSAGAVALLWSCNPGLVGQIDQTFQLLQNSADAPNDAGACGAPPDGQGNYTYGYGYLNVLAAGSLTCGTVQYGTLQGHVYDDYGAPLGGATVTAVTSTTTAADGSYSMSVPVGSYSVTASKYGYTSSTTDVVIVEGATTIQDFTLTYLGAWVDGTAPCFDWTRYDVEYYPATGLIYALGGRSGSDTIGDIYSYNPVTGACADTGANMPVPISNYTVNLVNNGSADVLCTFGGRNSAGSTILNVQCYNPLTNTASTVANLPSAWTGFTPGAQVVYNNKVYIFGGFNATSSPYETARTDRFDPVTNTFTQLGNLSLARSYLYAAEVDGKIYA